MIFRRFDGLREGLDVRVPVRRLLGHALGDRAHELLGHFGHQLAHRARALHHLLEEDRPGALAFERHRAGEHVIAHHRQRVLVGPVIDVRVAAGLLGAHVVRGADDRSRRGERGVGGGVHDLRDAEVHQQHAPCLALEHDVLGLDVAVDHAGLVCRLERPRGFHHDPLGFADRPAPVANQQRLEALAFDERHQDVHDAVGFTDIVDRNDVGMAQRRDRFGLPAEPAQQGLGEGQVGPDRLEREVAFKPEVANLEHLGEAAPADELSELIVLAEGLLELPDQLSGRIRRRLDAVRNGDLAGQPVDRRRCGRAAHVAVRRLLGQRRITRRAMPGGGRQGCLTGLIDWRTL